MKLQKISISQRTKSRVITCICGLTSLLPYSLACQASTKLTSVLHSSEGMKEHDSDDPRRLMHEVILSEVRKGNVFNTLNADNSPHPRKYTPAPYHFSANLIAFALKPGLPVRVSISMQLLRYSTGKVIEHSDVAMDMNELAIQQSLKLHKQEFDQSQYGKAIAELSRVAVKQFEEKVAKLQLVNEPVNVSP